MAEFASAKTVVVVHGGMSVPADEFKRVEGQSPELAIALGKLFDAAQALASSYVKDPQLRTLYHQKIRASADEIMDRVARGEITPHEGAQTANAMRNQIMEWTREQSTAIGRSAAKSMKEKGRSIPELEARYASDLYGRPMEQLNVSQQNRVWAEIVDASGRSRPGADLKVRLYGAAGKTLLVASLAISAYAIYESDDKVRESAKQAGGIGAAIAAGAAATAAFGASMEAAPVILVGMAVFVIGVLAVEATDELFDYLWPEKASQ